MHTYSTDESRIAVYGWLSVGAAILAWVMLGLTSFFDWPQWLVSIPSMGGAYALLYKSFDKWGWKSDAARRLGVSKTVDLSGVYAGSLTSTYPDSSGKATSVGFELTIHQTWTTISVCMEFASGSSASRSFSAVAGLTEQDARTRLKYLYRNDVNHAVADQDMSDHDGAADLLIGTDGKVSGRYFNARGNRGSIEAGRQ
jgi:hypothetical protein